MEGFQVFSMKQVWVGLLLFLGPVVAAQESEGEPCFPLTEAEMLDESTLNVEILMHKLVPSSINPGEKIRIVRARYYSHEWKDGSWYGTVTIVMPETIAPDRAGMMAVCPRGTINVEPEFDLELNFFEYTALKCGIPVMGLPNLGEHYGLSEIYQLSDFLNMRFVESGDPSWLAAYPSAAARSRGATLVSNLTGNPITSIVHMGSSISAGHGYVWARFDSRVKELVATGSIGCFRDLFPQDGSYHSGRPAVDALAAMEESMKQVFEWHRDPAVFGGELSCNVLLVTGVRDRFVPPLVVPRLLNALGGETRVLQVPEYGHGCGTNRHGDAFRMAIDRTLLGNKQPAIVDVQVGRSGTKLTCSAVVEGEEEDAEVRLWYLPVSDPLFFQSPNFPDTPEANYTSAEWESVPMRKEGGKWIVEVSYINPAVPDVAWFVDYQSGVIRDRKYASTRVSLLRPVQAAPEETDEYTPCLGSSIRVRTGLGMMIFSLAAGLGVILLILRGSRRGRGNAAA